MACCKTHALDGSGPVCMRIVILLQCPPPAWAPRVLGSNLNPMVPRAWEMENACGGFHRLGLGFGFCQRTGLRGSRLWHARNVYSYRSIELQVPTHTAPSSPLALPVALPRLPPPSQQSPPQLGPASTMLNQLSSPAPFRTLASGPLKLTCIYDT